MKMTTRQDRAFLKRFILGFIGTYLIVHMIVFGVYLGLKAVFPVENGAIVIRVSE